MGNIIMSRKYSLQTFQYNQPRAEACCQIGLCFIKENAYEKAVFWYELSTRLKRDSSGWSFEFPRYYTYLPHLQLCMCYYRLGNIQKAYIHHKLSEKYCPEHESVKYNRSYFKSLSKESLDD